MSILKDFHSARSRNNAPVTTAIVVLIVAGFLVCWMDASLRFFFSTALQTNSVIYRPWTLLTYPLATTDLLSVLFSALWLWGIGGVVEREEGSAKFAAFWLVMSLLCGVGLYVGSLVLDKPAILANAWTPIAAVTIVWGTRHPNDLVQFMLVLPVTARWMAWLSVAFVFFGTRTVAMGYAPLLAPFAAAPLALAWFYASKRLPSFGPSGRKGKSEFVRGAGFYSKEYFDDVKRREQDRAEKERLRKLLEGGPDDESG